MWGVNNKEKWRAKDREREEEVWGKLWWAPGCQLSGHESAASINKMETLTGVKDIHTHNPSHGHAPTHIQTQPNA